MAHPYAEHRAEHRARAGSVMSRCGYASGGAVDERSDAKMVSSGVHQHEAALHKGEAKTKLSLADGGASRQHLAKRARGGRAGKSVKVNVIVAPQGGGAAPAPMPMSPPRPPMGAPPMPPPGMPLGGPPGAPPMAGMGAGMPMPGRPPGIPGGPMMRARGGKVHMDAGAMSGPGRIEKAREYGEGGFKPQKRGIKGG